MKKMVRLILAIASLFIHIQGWAEKIKPDGADTALVRKHLTELVAGPDARNYMKYNRLEKTADYIEKVFRQYGDSIRIQKFNAGDKSYRNIICSFGTEHKRRMIIGAHYDVCGDQPGADDNASGTAALLELARMLHGKKLKYRIDLVAWTLEEPPFFDTEQMGSFIHAKEMKESGTKVLGAISVEMIGYFSDSAGSQQYPIETLKYIYGRKGNFITLVRKLGAGHFVRKFGRKFRQSHTIRTKTFAAPVSITGIDLSDHMNYWHFGFRAMMITDTSFYRNKNYHRATDTLETLDIKRMTGVIDAICYSILNY